MFKILSLFLKHKIRNILILVVLVTIGIIFTINHNDKPEWITATVERGNVSETVSVSGFIEAKQIADLAFSGLGVVTGVLANEGDHVEAGDIIATLAATQLVAERAEAVAALTSAKAAYDEKVSGPRDETLDLAKTSLRNAEENLARVTTEENRKVKNAQSALLSTGLTATTNDIEERSTPPVISGTYTCETEGTYSISVYSSGAKSGYSYNFTGLENGTEPVSSEQPAPLGSCGLYLLFTAGDIYSNSKWQIEVPNTRSSTYTTLSNAYNLTVTQAQNAIAGAKSALSLAVNENSLSTAAARPQEVTQASAAIRQAEARIAAIDARITDRSIVAPFAGTVTDVSITTGETAPSSAVVTILADNAFTLKARIPEIDITKIAVGQVIESIFDAKSNETLNGRITFISPIATQIDGVAYFETTIELDQTPQWMRAGLNADIDIITKRKERVLRLPKRFVVTQENGSHVVVVSQATKTATTTIETVFIGNDGFMEISGLTEGTVVVAP